MPPAGPPNRCVSVSRLRYYMDDSIRGYLATIGRAGGRKSRRTLDPETAREHGSNPGGPTRVPAVPHVVLLVVPGRPDDR